VAPRGEDTVVTQSSHSRPRESGGNISRPGHAIACASVRWPGQRTVSAVRSHADTAARIAHHAMALVEHPHRPHGAGSGGLSSTVAHLASAAKATSRLGERCCCGDLAVGNPTLLLSSPSPADSREREEITVGTGCRQEFRIAQADHSGKGLLLSSSPPAPGPAEEGGDEKAAAKRHGAGAVASVPLIVHACL
jgi:hypothetical protein